MRNAVLFLFVLFFANRLSAQEDSVIRAPDNDRIRYETLDSSSPMDSCGSPNTNRSRRRWLTIRS